MTRSARSPHPARAVLALACVVIASLVPVAAANAQSPPTPVSLSGVTVTAIGGDALATATCINAAKAAGKIQQVNQCQNAPLAVGGTVTLDKVSVLVNNPGAPGGVQRFDNVKLEARGGNATATAACINQAKSGQSEATGVNICTQTPTAVGGAVTLSNVDIKVAPATGSPGG